jgi:hypothetical protein
MSVTGANADTISETGAMTLRSASPSRQAVFIDSESLPTGIAIPSAGQNSSPTALTVSYRSASSPGSPHAAIQFADSRTSLNRVMSAATTFVIASATAMRPDAAGSSSASGVRSPIAIASPCVEK